MYRTLIVDDEQLMRQYLSNNLSSICPDFIVTGMACDGLEAVELLTRQSFDLVITDIKMPEMDGLKLAKYIFELETPAKVVIISGYNEFEYARLAIKYGVSDYLSKPLSDEGIYDTLTRVKEGLDEETSRKGPYAPDAEYPTYTDRELKAALLSALIHKNGPLIQQLYSILQDRELCFLRKYSSIMLLCLDELYLLLLEKKVAENTSYQLELNQQCRVYCNRKGYTDTYDESGYAIILLTADFEEEISLMANSIYQEFLSSYWRNDTIKLLSSYGYIVNDLMSLSASHLSAVKAFALTLINLPSPISSKYYISQSNFINKLVTICDSLYVDYVSKNSSKTLSDLYLYITLFQGDFSIAAILRYGTYLIRYLAEQCNIKNGYVIDAFRELTTAIDQEISKGTFDKDTTQLLLLRVLRVLDHDNLLVVIPECTNIVENAKEFICTHYHEQISLAMVADSLGVNTSYLSDLFHKIIGEPYTKFLTRIRMEQAILLLKSNPNEKIYRIAEKTGFVSSKHFNSVFKKYYGFTPTEYLMQRHGFR